VSGADAPRAAQKQPRGADLLIDELRDALGCATIGAKTREKWAAALRATLSECSAADRSTFVRWLVSSGYWCKDTVYRLSGELQKEAEAWLMAGKPCSKHRAQSATAPPPTDGILRDSQGRPVWLPERTSVVDHSWGYQRDAFVAYWGQRAEFLSAEKRAAAGIPDSIPWYPEMVQS
jgi:hypothetical protein